MDVQYVAESSQTIVPSEGEEVDVEMSARRTTKETEGAMNEQTDLSCSLHGEIVKTARTHKGRLLCTCAQLLLACPLSVWDGPAVPLQSPQPLLDICAQ